MAAAKPHKIALVGIGKIARDQHIPALAASADFDLRAAVSRNGEVEGLQNFSDFNEMLEACPDISVVSLCMPPVPRFEFARLALEAGRHVMLEKPPGATLAEVHALEALARAQNCSLYATWHSREAAQVSAAKAWLADKEITSMEVIWKEDVRRWHPGQDWIWQAGGLGVFDPGINALSIVTEIMPQALHLNGADLYFPANHQTPIAADLRFAAQNGADLRAQFDWRQEGDQIWTIEVQTKTGLLRLEDGGARLLIDGVEQPQPNSEAAPLGGEYPRLYANMSALLAKGASDVDLSPMVHVADAFTLGRRHEVAPFAF
ncbi:MAG: Gfo/Idh/MocA family protein [Paracoccaceae bacterium]